jgi:hypothetical protein
MGKYTGCVIIKLHDRTTGKSVCPPSLEINVLPKIALTNNKRKRKRVIQFPFVLHLLHCFVLTLIF